MAGAYSDPTNYSMRDNRRPTPFIGGRFQEIGRVTLMTEIGALAAWLLLFQQGRGPMSQTGWIADWRLFSDLSKMQTSLFDQIVPI